MNVVFLEVQALQDSSPVSWLLAFFVLGTSYLVPSPLSGLVLLWAAFWRRPGASEDAQLSSVQNPGWVV